MKQVRVNRHLTDWSALRMMINGQTAAQLRNLSVCPCPNGINNGLSHTPAEYIGLR